MSQDIAQAKEEDYQVTLEEALSLARGHHAARNFILAERTYRDILRSVPDHYPTTQMLGILLFQCGNFIDAKRFLEKALEAEPDNEQCINNYGGVLSQLGEIDEAIKNYKKAYELNPKNIDVLNNYAYALWSQGEYKAAEALNREALEIDPDNLLALNGLGMALAKQVKFEEAIDMWEKAAEINDENALFYINWGNTLREMGRFQQSEEICRKAVALEPNNPEALNNLGNALRDQGKVDEAITLYKDATDIRPEYAEAHVNLAIAYLDSSNLKNAVTSAKYAVAFNNEMALAYNILSKAQRELGEIESAHTAAQRAIYLDPDSAEPYLLLAGVLSQLDHYDDAEAAIQEALKREPDQARAFLELADIRHNQGEIDKAKDAIEKGLKISPEMPTLLVTKATICLQNNEPDEALESIDRAIESGPDWFVPYQQKADMLISLNRNDEAEVLVRKALSIKDDVPGPYATLAMLKKFESEDDPDFVKMKDIEERIADNGYSYAMAFYYTMSNVYEQMKKYDEAFEYLNKASKAKRKIIPYQHKEELQVYKTTREQMNKEVIEALARAGDPSEKPVFIVGMPRSGTTLTEQIISSHPDVHPAGELMTFGSLLSNVRQTGIGEEQIKYLSQGYLKTINGLDKSGKTLRVTDKMPGNYAHLGFIVAAFPNARIIHCRRNPIDTSLSCYKQNFARGQYWSYDMDELGDQYLNYLKMMEFWRETIPERFLEIDYEETVGNLEGQARKLIDYVGLPWDDACLEPHKQKRAVLTASKAQVTKPVYKTSVDKWKRYEKHLQPLVRKLMPDQALPEEELKNA